MLAFGGHTYSYMLSEPVDRTLGRLADLGFGSVEIMAHPGHLWPDELGAAERGALRRRCEQSAITPVLNVPNIDINIAATTAAMRRYSVDLLADVVQLAGDLGAPGVVMGPGKANPLLPAPAEALTGYFFAALERLSPLAASAGTALWLENMPFAFLPEAPRLATALDAFGDPDIGAVYDFANGYFIGEDPAAGLAAFRDRLALVHLSDTGRDVYRHAAFGCGTMPTAPIPALLRQAGYRGAVVLEIVSGDPDTDLAAGLAHMTSLDWEPGG